MDNNLQPCPFCGGERITEVIGDYGLHYMVCQTCGAVVTFHNDFAEQHPEQTKALWNRRTK